MLGIEGGSAPGRSKKRSKRKVKFSLRILNKSVKKINVCIDTQEMDCDSLRNAGNL